jgi:hypothetical protein
MSIKYRDASGNETALTNMFATVQTADVVQDGNTNPVTSNAVYDTVTNPIKLINALFNPNTRRVGTGIRKFLDNGTNGNWTHTAVVTGVYEFTSYKHNHGNTMTIYVNDIAVCSSPFWGTASDGTTQLDQSDISWSPVIYVKKGDAIRIESDNTREQAKSRWFLNSYNFWGDNT